MLQISHVPITSCNHSECHGESVCYYFCFFRSVYLFRTPQLETQFSWPARTRGKIEVIRQLVLDFRLSDVDISRFSNDYVVPCVKDANLLCRPSSCSGALPGSSQCCLLHPSGSHKYSYDNQEIISLVRSWDEYPA